MSRADKMLLVILAVIAIGLLCFFVQAMRGASARASYRHVGPVLLNDLRLTPGAVRTTDKSKLCPHADTKAVRNVTEAEKKQVCDEYGVPAAKCTGANYEVDHLVSLELGGSNDVKNLWPQPYAGKFGARTKDKVEDWLHAQVCKGNIPLPAAQHWIAKNWYAEWELMEAK